VTEHNPYLPPASTVADEYGAAPPPPKPWAVTIAQVLGSVCAAFMAVGIARYLYGVWEWSRIGVRMVWSPYFNASRIAMLVVLVVMLIQLPKRSQVGRWCGAAILLAALGGLIYLLVTSYPSGGGTLEIGGHILSFLVCFVPTAWLLYAFGFSRKARAYFGSTARN
jgi:hypothetical protein